MLDSAVRRLVSAVNAGVVVTLDLQNLHDSLAIHAVTSAGTTTVAVDVTADGGTTWLPIDAAGAGAGTFLKQYLPTTVGATTALCPLAFPQVRVTATAAGAGNTVTLTVVAK